MLRCNCRGAPLAAAARGPREQRRTLGLLSNLFRLVFLFITTVVVVVVGIIVVLVVTEPVNGGLNLRVVTAVTVCSRSFPTLRGRLG